MFSISLRKDILVRKLLGRRVCPSCNGAYNVVSIDEDGYNIPPMLPKHDPCKCDKCRVDLIQRKDDNHEVIEKRQNIYLDQMKNIIEFYS